MLMAVVETAGIASVLPFLAVLSDPEIMIQTDEVLAGAYDMLAFESVECFCWRLE